MIMPTNHELVPDRILFRRGEEWDVSTPNTTTKKTVAGHLVDLINFNRTHFQIGEQDNKFRDQQAGVNIVVSLYVTNDGLYVAMLDPQDNPAIPDTYRPTLSSKFPESLLTQFRKLLNETFCHVLRTQHARTGWGTALESGIYQLFYGVAQPRATQTGTAVHIPAPEKRVLDFQVTRTYPEPPPDTETVAVSTPLAKRTRSTS